MSFMNLKNAKIMLTVAIIVAVFGTPIYLVNEGLEHSGSFFFVIGVMLVSNGINYLLERAMPTEQENDEWEHVVGNLWRKKSK